jgi:hypothetical protein
MAAENKTKRQDKTRPFAQSILVEKAAKVTELSGAISSGGSTAHEPCRLHEWRDSVKRESLLMVTTAARCELTICDFQSITSCE